MDYAAIPLFLAREIVRYGSVIEHDAKLYRSHIAPSRLREKVRKGDVDAQGEWSV
jgi:hypothetical protein